MGGWPFPNYGITLACGFFFEDEIQKSLRHIPVGETTDY